MTEPRTIENPLVDAEGIPADARAAAETLLYRMAVESRRGSRAAIGSKARRRAIQNGRFLRWAAGQIISDRKLQQKLRDAGVLGVGWRPLAVALSKHAREQLEKAGV